MRRTRSKICTNIYGCSEAAKLKDADTIPEFQDKCSSCGSDITYPAFMKQFYLCACPVCSRMAYGKNELPLTSEQILKLRPKLRESHCLLCGCEYKSLEEESSGWIVKAARILETLLGNPEISELAEEFYRLCESMGCDEMNRVLKELLHLITEEKRELIEEKIRKAESFLRLYLVDFPNQIKM